MAVKIKDKAIVQATYDGKDIYYVTPSEAVYMSDGRKMEDYLNDRGFQLDNDYTVFSPDTIDQYIVTTTIPFKIADSKGTSFTIDNGNIKIGKGIRKCKISGIIDVSDSVEGNKSMQVYLNDSYIISINQYLGANQRGSFVISPLEFNCKDNDVVKVIFSSDHNMSIRGAKEFTYLRLEAIETDSPKAVIAIDEDNKYSFSTVEVLDRLDSINPKAALSANQGNILNTKIIDYINLRDNFIMVRANQDIVWAGTQNRTSFNFHQLWKQSGDMFVKTDLATIKINSDKVHTVKVTVHVQKNEEQISGKWWMGYICKNGTPQIRCIEELSKWVAIDSSIYLDVVKGDRITFAVAADYTGNITFPTYDSFAGCNGMSYMIVEAIN